MSPSPKISSRTRALLIGYLLDSSAFHRFSSALRRLIEAEMSMTRQDIPLILSALRTHRSRTLLSIQ